jgi:hypothetical protein
LEPLSAQSHGKKSQKPTSVSATFVGQRKKTKGLNIYVTGNKNIWLYLDWTIAYSFHEEFSRQISNAQQVSDEVDPE